MTAKKPKAYIGTSGWSYNHWQGAFYPDDLPRSRYFEYYLSKFDTVEINNSFYNLPEKSTFENWRQRSPDGFIFAVKASRYITHMKKLKDPGKPVKTFLANAGVLKDKQGPILFQLPPRWHCNLERLAAFLEMLPAKNRYAFEFRDDTWWNTDVSQLLTEYEAAFGIFDLEGRQSPQEITSGDFVYVRLHGPGGAYQGLYGKRRLTAWADRISRWLSDSRDVYCYFDNDEKGYAARDALMLKGLIAS